MIALDTNVLVRAVAEETVADPATLRQRAQARALLGAGGALFLPLTVLLEFEWVMRAVYAVPKDDLAGLLDDLLTVEGLVVDRAGAVAQALAHYRQGMDLADALHLALSSGCVGLASFDRRFAQIGARLGLQPTVAEPARWGLRS